MNWNKLPLTSPADDCLLYTPWEILNPTVFEAVNVSFAEEYILNNVDINVYQVILLENLLQSPIGDGNLYA